MTTVTRSSREGTTALSEPTTESTAEETTEGPEDVTHLYCFGPFNSCNPWAYLQDGVMMIPTPPGFVTAVCGYVNEVTEDKHSPDKHCAACMEKTLGKVCPHHG